jgi:LPXTG-motif cell wall-anchored protein
MRRISAIAVAAVCTLAGAHAAGAGYSAPAATISMSNTNPGPGDAITVNAGGLLPGSSVQITATPESAPVRFTSAATTIVLASGTADSAGNASVSVVPSALLSSGSYSVCIVGLDAANAAVTACSGMALSAPTTSSVSGPLPSITQGADGNLPSTGSNATKGLTMGALALVAAGATTVVVSRRKRVLG